MMKLMKCKYTEQDMINLRKFFDYQDWYINKYKLIPLNAIVFKSNYITIHHPWYDKTGSFIVDPFKYYGQPFVDIIPLVLERY